MQRVLRQRELVESMKHENEVLRLDLTRESRDVRGTTSSSATTDISRFLHILISLSSCLNVYIFSGYKMRLADT